MISLMNDSRVAFLIWFIGAAIVVAVVLIFIEIRLKRKKVREVVKMREQTPIDKMEIVLAESGDAKKKLIAVNIAAKNYFKEEYGMPAKLDYSELAKDFKKKGKGLEVEFCKGMFEAYYSNKELTNKKIGDLGNLLIEANEQKKIVKRSTRAPGVFDKVDNFLGNIKDAVVGKAEKRVVAHRERTERDTRVKEKGNHELLTWVRKAIRAEYDEKKITSLLKDGKRSNKEIKKILNFYRMELKKVSRENVVSSGEGVAQRIIKKERGKLEE